MIVALATIPLICCQIRDPYTSLLPQPSSNRNDDITREFAQFKAIVLDDLNHPERCVFGNGLPDEDRFLNRMTLVCGWTDPDFINAEQRLVNDDGMRRIIAIACLMRYRIPFLDRTIEAYRDYHFTRWLSPDLAEPIRVGDFLDAFHKLGTVPNFARSIDIPLQVDLLQHGKDIERQVAWFHLLESGWMTPFRLLGLNPLVLRQRGSDDKWLGGIFDSLVVGHDHAIEFFHDLRERAPDETTRSEATAMLWRLGNADEGPACRSLIKGLIEKIGKLPDPSYNPHYDSYAILFLLCDRPDPLNVDLYTALTQCASSGMRDHGWSAMVHLDTRGSIGNLDNMLRTIVGKENLSGIQYAVQLLGESGTPNRDRWLKFLMDMRPMLLDDSQNSSWIDAFSSMAGHDFGSDGREYPIGFDKNAARKTTTAIQSWYLDHQRTKSDVLQPGIPTK
jgi:hypothetical protein